jgi:hypothetical protein
MVLVWRGSATAARPQSQQRFQLRPVQQRNENQHGQRNHFVEAVHMRLDRSHVTPGDGIGHMPHRRRLMQEEGGDQLSPAPADRRCAGRQKVAIKTLKETGPVPGRSSPNWPRSRSIRWCWATSLAHLLITSAMARLWSWSARNRRVRAVSHRILSANTRRSFSATDTQPGAADPGDQ